MTFEEMKCIVDLSPYPRPAPMTEAEMREACEVLLKFLLREQGLIGAFSATYAKKRELLRGYLNGRMPLPVPRELLDLQDRLLRTESLLKGIVSVEEIPTQKHGIGLWQGDITRLQADGIVNAANSEMLGCFVPGHTCIDNAIHSAAGMQLRADCAKLIASQGHGEAAGGAKLTRAYNLPARFVLHTVGPMVGRELTKEDRMALRSCYISCLNLAEEAGLSSIAFPCIGTGIFGFPRTEAAEIATGAVMNWKLRHPENTMRVIFNTYLPEDTRIYEDILRLM